MSKKKSNTWADDLIQTPKGNTAQEAELKLVNSKNAPTIGRPPKKEAEKCIYKAQLNFTESEWNQLKDKAGYAPIGTFLKAMLKEQKVFE